MASRSHSSCRSLWPLRITFEPRRPTPPSPRTILEDFGRAKFLYGTGVYFVKSNYDTNDYMMTPKNMETSSSIPNVYDCFDDTP
ncbi:hypothetical protein TRIUR3_31925 [Triticum urartu]|uniref:Uncharacterized protein n=1 Tax=Triticum urartu TaxID=4572 RepID=M7ZSL1_TRIUA|nr:hypothetical protein TRIUR3_31925 [Triticum urartu]